MRYPFYFCLTWNLEVEKHSATYFLLTFYEMSHFFGKKMSTYQIHTWEIRIIADSKNKTDIDMYAHLELAVNF